MATFKVMLKQGYKVFRFIPVEIEAGSMDEALEIQTERDAPSFEDPRWMTNWDLQNEEVHPVEGA